MRDSKNYKIGPHAFKITFSDLNIRSSTLLSDLGWDPLERRRSKKLAITLFKILHNVAPTRLNSLLKTTSSVHSHTIQNTTFSFLDRALKQANEVFNIVALFSGTA